MGVFNVLGIYIKNSKILFAKIFIIFIPVFLIAHFTKNMVYILPTLAIGLMLGASFNKDQNEEEEDGDDASNDASE